MTEVIIRPPADFYTGAGADGIVISGLQTPVALKNEKICLVNSNGNIITAATTDGTLVANSDTMLATEKAVKTYVDAHSAPSVSVLTPLVLEAGVIRVDNDQDVRVTSISVDPAMAADSNEVLPTQHSVKSYVDQRIPTATAPVYIETGSIKLKNNLNTVVTTISTDSTMAAGSDQLIPTQAAAKIYIGNQVNLVNAKQTGLVTGGILSKNIVNADRFDVSAGTGYYVNYWTTPSTPITTLKSWSAFSNQLSPYLATNSQSWVYLDFTATPPTCHTQVAMPTVEERKTKCVIGRIYNLGVSTLTHVHFLPTYSFESNLETDILINEGSSKAIASDFSLLVLNLDHFAVTPGKAIRKGCNSLNVKDVNAYTVSANITSNLYAARYNGANMIALGTLNLLLHDLYDNGGASFGSVPYGSWSNQRVVYYPSDTSVTELLLVYLDKQYYTSYSLARQALADVRFDFGQEGSNGIEVGAFVIQSSATAYDLTNPASAVAVNYRNYTASSDTFDPSEVLAITNTTQSTTSANGSITTLGGAGIAKNLNVGGVAVITNTASQLKLAFDGSNSTTMTVNNAGDMTIDCSGNDLNLSSTDAIHVLNTSDSSVLTGGAMIVSGAASIVKNACIGGQLRMLNQGVGSVNIYIDNTGAGSNNGENRVISALKGLMGSEEKNYISMGRDVNPNNRGYTGFIYSGSSGSVNNRMSTAIHGNPEFSVYADRCVVNQTAESTSTTTGALQCLGGAGITKNVNAGGTITTTTDDGLHFINATADTTVNKFDYFKTSGVISGCLITINVSGSTIDISAGSICFVDLITDASVSKSRKRIVPFSGATNLTLTALATDSNTWVYLAVSGGTYSIVQRVSVATVLNMSLGYIQLGRVFHPNHTSINSIYDFRQSTAVNTITTLTDLVISGAKQLGTGLFLSTVTALQFGLSDGNVSRVGISYATNLGNPNLYYYGGAAPATFLRVYTNATNTDITVESTTTSLDPTRYNNAGTLTNITTNRFSWQLFEFFPSQTSIMFVIYGTEEFLTLDDAILSALSANVYNLPDSALGGIMRAAICMRQDITSLAVAVGNGTAKIVYYK